VLSSFIPILVITFSLNSLNKQKPEWFITCPMIASPYYIGSSVGTKSYLKLKAARA